MTWKERNDAAIAWGKSNTYTGTKVPYEHIELLEWAKGELIQEYDVLDPVVLTQYSDRYRELRALEKRVEWIDLPNGRSGQFIFLDGGEVYMFFLLKLPGSDLYLYYIIVDMLTYAKGDTALMTAYLLKEF
jgi:hypothetical protein